MNLNYKQFVISQVLVGILGVTAIPALALELDISTSKINVSHDLNDNFKITGGLGIKKVQKVEKTKKIESMQPKFWPFTDNVCNQKDIDETINSETEKNQENIDETINSETEKELPLLIEDTALYHLQREEIIQDNNVQGNLDFIKDLSEEATLQEIAKQQEATKVAAARKKKKTFPYINLGVMHKTAIAKNIHESLGDHYVGGELQYNLHTKKLSVHLINQYHQPISEKVSIFGGHKFDMIQKDRSKKHHFELGVKIKL